jgi:L-iditol 2-dehydrogenase
MKAVSVAGKGKVQIEEIPRPEVSPGALLLKVIYCSLCGSDIERVYGPHWDTNNPLLANLKGSILGHEWVGKVEEIGEGVEGWSVGDRTVDGRLYCGRCWYCVRGMSFLCMGGRVRGHPYDEYAKPETAPITAPPRYGALAEYVLRPAAGRLKVPQHVSDEEAAMSEPLATGITSVLNAEVRLAESTVVIGCGHIGLSVLAAAKAAGAAPLIAIDKIDARLEVARDMGANITLNATKVDVIEEVVNITGAGPDVIFLATSSQAPGIVEQAFEMVRYHGRIMIVGQAAPATLLPGRWLTKEVRIEGTVHMGEAMIPAMKLIENGQVNLKPMITEIIPLVEAQRAFDSMHNSTNIAVLLKP